MTGNNNGMTGQPIRLHELNIPELTKWLYENNIRWKNGKRIGEEVLPDGTRRYIGLHTGQEKIVGYPSRFKVVACGRRFGKTAVATLVALATIMQPNRRVWVVGPEYVHVEKVFQELYTILVTQLKFIGKHKPNTVARKSKGDYYLETEWGSIIEGKSASNMDSMAGEGLDLVIVDEAGLIPDFMTVWDQMLRPTLSDKSGSGIFISTPRGKNDFYKLYKLGELGIQQTTGIIPIVNYENGTDNDVRDWASWSMPTYSNPFIPAEEYHSAKKEALIKGKYTAFKQEYDADFESVSDAAFSEFKINKKIIVNGAEELRPYHVQPYAYNPSYGPWFAACDFNLAKPASTVYAQLDTSNNIIIFDEMFRPNTNAFVQAELILEKVKELKVPYANVIGDISGSFKHAGVNSFDQMETVLGHKPVGRKERSREAGNHLLHQWLAYPIIDKHGNLVLDEDGDIRTMPRLFVSPNCIETIHALETAKRSKGRDGSFKDDYSEFPSGHEGLLDAIRYLLCYLFSPKESVTIHKGIT
jgi:hypothetical protein